MTKKIPYLAVLLLTLATLSGCGIRPNQLDPPGGKDDRKLYPRPYPDPATVDTGSPVAPANSANAPVSGQ